MPANGQTSSSFNALDFRASQCIATFGGQQIGYLTRVTELRQQSGKDPSYALILVPLDVRDRKAPTLCGLSGSVLNAIKHLGQLVQCQAVLLGADGSSTVQAPMLNGRVVDINQEIFQDKAVVRVHDDRHLMEGVRLPGSLWACGDPGGFTVQWRPGMPAHTNPGGRPNCIWAAGGTVPVFCHPFTGLKDAEEPPDASAHDEKRACYWTPQSLFIYLQHFATADFGSFATATPWLARLPSSINWPVGLDSALVDATGGATRKVREMTLEGNLLDALCQIVEAAGPNAIWLQPNPDGSSDLKIVKTKYFPSGNGGSGSQGASIPRAAGGAASQTFTRPGIVVAGSIRENSQNLYTRVAVAGGLSFVETRVTAGAQTSTASPPADDSPLIPGWSDADLQTMKQEILDLINSKTVFTSLDDAIKFTTRKYPSVLRRWLLNPSYDFQTGTSYEGFPRCSTTRNPKPHLDSSYINDQKDSTQSSLIAALNTKREIPLEVDPTFYDTGKQPDDKNFGLLPITCGVEIASDGSIDLSGLFEQFASGVNAHGLFAFQPAGSTGTYNFADPATLTISRIRLTISIPTDFRLYGSAKLANDPTATETFPTSVDDSDRIDFSSGGRLAYVNALGLLQLEQRHDSWPIPESCTTAKKAPDGKIRDDSDEANNQAARKLEDLGRLDRTSQLVSNKMALTYAPGTMIDNINNIGGPGGSYPIRNALRAIHYHFEDRPQRMILIGA